MHLNPHVMVAKRWVTYKEFVVQRLKLVRRTFLLITSGSEIYNVQFLSTHSYSETSILMRLRDLLNRGVWTQEF